MHLGEREMTEREAHAPGERAQHRLDDRVRHPAVGALVVAVLQQCHGRGGRPQHVIALADGEN
jgi:hypothetical protein